MKIIEKPVTQIVVDQLIEMDIDEFLDESLGGETIGWCEGYLLGFLPADGKKFDKGVFEEQIRYYRDVIYCKYPTYQHEIKNRLAQTLVITNHSTSRIRQAFVEYIKNKDVPK